MDTCTTVFKVNRKPVESNGHRLLTSAYTYCFLRHADGEGNELTYNVDGVNYPLVSAVEWIGEDGLEELHLWFAMGWFDMGSWGWGNYITDWGTKGIFQGERRYYLGPVVDDLLLGTNVFIYDGAENEGPLFRMSGQDLVDFGASLDSINAKYGSEVIVDFAYNGNGILEKVNSAFTLSFDDADAALLPKGQKISGNGIAPLHDPEWLSTGITGMATEFLTNLWQSDDLLASVLSDAMKTKFHWQSHTMSHLARDNLGISDCTIEDQANIEIAKLTGFYYGNENFNWYSMTSPGITGLFNEFCLSSGADQLMICYPGDNTYVGEGTVSLVADNKFHPLTTTVATNGYNGATIVPRFATFVYYNCVTPDCLVQENEYIRRIVCGCAELDPSLSTGECPLCNGDIQSFGSMANLIAWEKETTTRQILSGFRDKYMFHQANVIPTTVDGVSGKSLLQYWIEEMMTGLTSFIKLPVKTLKFDHLCENFQWHEALDNAEPLLKANKDASGVLTSVTLSSSSGSSGYIPFTVPSDMTVDVSSIDGGSSVTYGSDKTYYFATPGNTVETYKAGPVEKTAEYLDAQVVACKKLCIINEACKSFSGDVKTACKKNCKKNCKKCILKNNENKC
ncbi:unnamed protein product [Choristocarpus tenellus]